MMKCKGLNGECKRIVKNGEEHCSVHKAHGECPICLDEIKGHTKYITSCGHIFHKKCAKVWFKSNSSCPMCRIKLDTPYAQNHVVIFSVIGNDNEAYVLLQQHVQLHVKSVHWTSNDDYDILCKHIWETMNAGGSPTFLQIYPVVTIEINGVYKCE